MTAISAGARSGRIFHRLAPNTGRGSSTRCWRRRSRDLQSASPLEIFDKLTQATSVLALQSGEPGPFAQAIAGIDLAVWDLYARRRKWPLVETARRQPAARSRSMPAASIRPARGRWRKPRWPRASRVETEDRLRSCEPIAPISHRFASSSATACWPPMPTRPGRSAQALEIAPQSRRIRPRLAGGADPCRPAVGGMAGVAQGASTVPLAAGENIASRAGFKQALGGRRVAGRSARYREMGRARVSVPTSRATF